jgi:Rne/Rng family ribonuclease
MAQEGVSMTKELLISSSPHETKVAVLEDDQLVEVYFQRDTDVGLVGGIYKGRVNRVLPGMQSAFVDIGLERDAFLYVSDFFEDSEEYDRVFTEAENRVSRMTSEEDNAPAIPSTEAPAQEELKTEGASTAEAPISLPAAAEPVAGETSSAPMSQPHQAQASPQGNADTSSVAVGAGENAEYKRREFFGRRHRRRGRHFREGRFGGRHEAPEHRESSPSRGLELLPGESLAKYGHAAQETAETSSESSSTLAEANRIVEPEPSQPAVESLTAAHEPLASNAETSLHSAWKAESAMEETPGVDETHPAPALAPVEDHSTLSEVESLSVSEWGSKPFSEPDTAESRTEGFEVHSEFEAENEVEPPSEELEATEPLSSLSSESEEMHAPEATPAEDAASASATEKEATGESSEQSYTLRESPHRPRVAPHRNRRGRGRFRGHRGRRHESGASHGQDAARGANYQTQQIHELLKEGQEILVQIAKEPLGTKGARITSHIALPGRYLVYMPTISHIGVSRKIASEEERLRLRNIILENKGTLTGGFIVRTAGAGRTEEELKADLAFLTNLWNDIRAKAERTKAPALLHRDLTLVERILRDLLSPEFKTIRVDNEIEYQHVLDFVNRFQPALVGHVKLYTRDTPLFEEFGVQAEIDKALKPKVWLKSGGYIVLNQTEALVAIDVNTGKYVGKTNRLEDTIVRTNIDAVKEIVRQIRLRDLGGIIVIDFIDMDERRNRTKVVQALEEALRHDRAPTKILSFNEFGLVALTRKRVKHSLERTLCEPCPYCTGSGWIKSVATVSYEIVSECRKMASQIEGDTLHLRVNPAVAAHLKARDGVLISEIESATHKDVVIKSDPSVHQEQFEIF